MTVSFVMQPAKLSDTFPITRLPKTGRAGWGDGLSFSTTDTTAPEPLGANSGLYGAIGDVTLTAGAPPPKAQRFQSYTGMLSDIRIYNRALSAEEISRQPAATP